MWFLGFIIMVVVVFGIHSLLRRPAFYGMLMFGVLMVAG